MVRSVRAAWRFLRRSGALIAAFMGALGLAATAVAQTPRMTADGRPDYSDPATWLCRPDLTDNRCKVDLDTTVIAPSGKMRIEKYVPAKNPKIDCFFVYPTVSKDRVGFPTSSPTTWSGTTSSCSSHALAASAASSRRCIGSTP